MAGYWMGSLTKCEVAALLRNRGCDIKDVNELNHIMKEMGLLIYSEEQWSTTEEAVKYTICESKDDEAIWNLSLVDAIFNFWKNK